MVRLRFLSDLVLSLEAARFLEVNPSRTVVDTGFVVVVDIARGGDDGGLKSSIDSSCSLGTGCALDNDFFPSEMS